MMRFPYRHSIRTTHVAILAIALASCGGQGPAGPASATFALSSTALFMSPDDNQRTVTITNLDDDPLDWRVLSTTASWLMASPTSGALDPRTSETFTVRVDPLAVTRGAHAAALQIGASGHVALINVSVQESTVSPADPSIQPSMITIGPQNPSTVVEVINAGGSPLVWTLTGPSWATLTPASGTLAAGARTQVVVTTTSSGLTNGQYVGALRLSSNAETRTATLVLDVSRTIPLDLEPDRIDFGSTTTELPMRIKNQGSQSIQWSAIPGKPWLHVSPSTGTLPPGLQAMVNVTVTRSGMSLGHNETTLAFTSADGAVTATVSAEVLPAGEPGPSDPEAARLSISPVSLDFQQSATVLTLFLHNEGHETLQWTGEPEASWIMLPVASGSVPANGTEPLSVAVSRSGLTAGTYRSDLRFSSNGGTAVAAISMTVSGSDSDSTPTNSAPHMNLTPAALDFGSTATGLDLVVQNSGDAPLDWSAVAGSAWFTLAPTSGRVEPGAARTIRVSALRSSLPAAGLYESEIQFVSNGGNRAVPVSLRVNGSPPPPPPPGGGGLAGIDASGVKDVTNELNAYLESVPDGSVIQFPAGARYRIEGVLQLLDRHDLTIEGNGATVFANTNGKGITPPEDIAHLWPRQRSHVMITGGSNIVIRNLVVRGANPNAGSAEGAYVAEFEGQHGFDIKGVVGVTLENVTVTDTYGDFVYLSPLFSVPTFARDIVVRDSHFERSGRQGIAITGAEDVLFENNYIGEVGRTVIDIEPLGANWGAHRITFQNNTFGPCRHLLMSSGGGGANVYDINFIGNRLVGIGLKIKAIPADGSRRSGYRIIDNISEVLLGLPVPAIRIHRADGIEVHGNYQVMAENREMIGVFACESTGVSVSDNDFPGAVAELAVASVCPIDED